jgi:hypothetical protein
MNARQLIVACIVYYLVANLIAILLLIAAIKGGFL